MITVAVGFYIHDLLNKENIKTKEVVSDVDRKVVSIDRYVREFYRQDALGRLKRRVRKVVVLRIKSML